SKKLTELYEQMWLIRLFDEKVDEFFAKGKIHGTTHLAVGQEASAAGVCALLDDSDKITSTHRGHGHCIAKGADTRYMMAELFGRETGYCKIGRASCRERAEGTVRAGVVTSSQSVVCR